MRRGLALVALQGLGRNLAGGFFVNIVAVKKLARGGIARVGQTAQCRGVHEIGRQLGKRPCRHALAYGIHVFQPLYEPGAGGEAELRPGLGKTPDGPVAGAA